MLMMKPGLLRSIQALKLFFKRDVVGGELVLTWVRIINEIKATGTRPFLKIVFSKFNDE